MGCQTREENHTQKIRKIKAPGRQQREGNVDSRNEFQTFWRPNKEARGTHPGLRTSDQQRTLE